MDLWTTWIGLCLVASAFVSGRAFATEKIKDIIRFLPIPILVSVVFFLVEKGFYSKTEPWEIGILFVLIAVARVSISVFLRGGYKKLEKKDYTFSLCGIILGAILGFFFKDSLSWFRDVFIIFFIVDMIAVAFNIRYESN